MNPKKAPNLSSEQLEVGAGQELDRILAGEATLLPSSGFAASVMLQIEQQASAPDIQGPIPFPWRWALPGIAALIASLGSLLWLVGSALRSTPFAHPAALLTHANLSFVHALTLRSPLGTAAMALAGDWLCLLLARRMAGESSWL